VFPRLKGIGHLGEETWLVYYKIGRRAMGKIKKK